jgi:hypothetical protein
MEMQQRQDQYSNDRNEGYRMPVPNVRRPDLVSLSRFSREQLF